MSVSGSSAEPAVTARALRLKSFSAVGYIQMLHPIGVAAAEVTIERDEFDCAVMGAPVEQVTKVPTKR
jgi:hypothetical protein